MYYGCSSGSIIMYYGGSRGSNMMNYGGIRGSNMMRYDGDWGGRNRTRVGNHVVNSRHRFDDDQKHCSNSGYGIYFCTEYSCI